MRDKEAIDKELEEAKNSLVHVRGGPCEVYQRIVGYMRNVNRWNAGKREEYDHRKTFTVPSIPFLEAKAADCNSVVNMV